MAQVAAWIDSERYAVGRWDGSMSIFDSSDGADGRSRSSWAPKSVQSYIAAKLTPDWRQASSENKSQPALTG